MADGFEAFHDRYRLDAYDLSIIGKNPNGPGGDAVGTTETKELTWLEQKDHPSIATFQPYKIANYFSKSGKIVRINNELYDELWPGSDPDDVSRKKKPAKIVVRHHEPRFWNPLTWKRAFRVHVVPRNAAPTNFPLGKAGQYVSTIGLNGDMIETVSKRIADGHEFALLRITPGKTPLWDYLLARHPSDAINLSVIFLYISAIISIVGEGYEWPKIVHDTINGSIVASLHFLTHVMASLK